VNHSVGQFSRYVSNSVSQSASLSVSLISHSAIKSFDQPASLSENESNGYTVNQPDMRQSVNEISRLKKLSFIWSVSQQAAGQSVSQEINLSVIYSVGQLKTSAITPPSKQT
jgi:hypothetical protein